MKMYKFPFDANESYAFGFFILPRMDGEHKIILDFPHADTVVDTLLSYFKQNGNYSPAFDFYRLMDPDYDRTMLFCELYNITRITPFNVYLSLTWDPEHIGVALKLKEYRYIHEKALKSPIVCGKCLNYLYTNHLVDYDKDKKMFYFSYDYLPDSLKKVIDDNNLDKNKYLFTREVFYDTGLPDYIEKRI